MQTESAAFTVADLPHFFEEILVWDAKATADRLRRGNQRMHELAPRIPDGAPEASEGWNAKEVLAHIAVLSRAYGVFSYMVAKGKLTDLTMESVITQRDVVGAEMAARPVADIVAEADRQHQRTLKFLAEVTPGELLRTVKIEHGELTVEYLLRLPLVAHLEQHLDQLEKALP
jgi:DinB superfamily